MIMDMEKGLLMKGVGGFYFVEVADTVYECKVRGLFRKKGITPLAGDRVGVGIESDGTCTIREIFPRRNFLVRPPVANIDRLFVVASVCEPVPSTLVLDKIIAMAQDREIEPVVVASKTDLKNCEWLREIYTMAGIPFVAVSSVTGEGVEEVRTLLRGKISAFTGNSGVGKSSLLNRISQDLRLQTGEISHKLGRGRHTTRQVELLRLENGTYVADTPGFSSVDIEHKIKKENLQFCFREFAPYLGRCRFPSCTHVREKDCAVLRAVADGKIHPSRHASYAAMYEEVKDVKEWQLK